MGYNIIIRLFIKSLTYIKKYKKLLKKQFTTQCISDIINI